MKRATILALVTFLVGFVLAAVVLRPRPATVAVAAQPAQAGGLSAAGSITLILLGLVGLILVTGVGLIVAVMVMQGRQKAARWEQTAALLGGSQQRQAAPRPQRRPQIEQGNGPHIIVVGGGGPNVQDWQ